MRALGLVLFFQLVLSPPLAAMSAAEPFDPGRLGFAVRANGVETAYRVFAVFVLPGERVEFTSEQSFELAADAGHSSPLAQGWAWTAPREVGWYPLALHSGGEAMTVNAFVLRPAADVEAGRLGDYRIGDYLDKPLRDLPAYQAPRGFIEVTPQLRDLQVAPHFTLGQFLCKQESDWPKYLDLRPELLIKLERVLERVNQHGIRTDSFEIMSGYRTPWYNAAIGNRTAASQHLYGGAADIFIDVAPRDGVMDDVNGDGRVSKADADYLYDLFELWSKSAVWWRRLSGGLAAYDATAAHGPFVHIDARGYRARWGR